MDLSWLVTIFIIVNIIILIIYALYMSSTHGTFKKMGIPGPSPWPVLGSFGMLAKMGMIGFQMEMYGKYRHGKVHGVYESRKPILVVQDLDMIRDITVKHFNYFVNRRYLNTDEPFNHSMNMLRDDHWKSVRTILSPTFSTAKLRRLFTHIEKNAKILRDNLLEKQEQNEEVELRDFLSCFTLDVIASTGFGVEINSIKDPQNQAAQAMKKMFGAVGRFFFIEALIPFMWPILNRLHLGGFPQDSVEFITKFVDATIQNRKQEQKGTSSRHDFLQLMIEAEDDDGTGDANDNMTEEEAKALKTSNARKKLTYLDIQGQAFIFILAGFDTVSTVMSFTMYLLALNPECCQKAQEEIDEKLGSKFPTYDAVQELSYLDMCINEAIRLYPPGFVVDRECSADVEIQGVRIPKGMIVLFPMYAIHHDPVYWPDPERFDPERFTPENKATRHPYAHLPFGQGPRNCIGMRLALLEMKVGLCAILQTMTPVTCSKSEFPIVLENFQLRAQKGLWVKMEARKP